MTYIVVSLTGGTHKTTTMKNVTTFTNFEEGNIYTMQFVGDSSLAPKYICTTVTSKFATFQGLGTGDVIRRKIQTFRGVEKITLGSYSKAPSIWADRVVG